MTELFLPGLCDPAAGAVVRHLGHSPAAAAAQADAVFDALDAWLTTHGALRTDLCKVTMMITDRAWREAVYGVLGRRLGGVWPVSTGLIVKGLADPDALFQLDAYAVSGGPHDRFRRYRSGDIAYGLHRQGFSMEFCMVVRAGRRVFLRGQTGMDLGRTLTGLNDAAAQAEQAVRNVDTLLADAGATRTDVTRVVTYVTDRAWLQPVQRRVVDAFPDQARTALVIKGLAAPELLMEIDVHAVLPDGASRH